MTKRTWLALPLLTLTVGPTLAAEYPFDLYRVSGIYSGKIRHGWPFIMRSLGPLMRRFVFVKRPQA